MVWNKLLPALKSEPLPANPAANERLKIALAELAVPEKHVPNTLRLPGSK